MNINRANLNDVDHELFCKKFNDKNKFLTFTPEISSRNTISPRGDNQNSPEQIMTNQPDFVQNNNSKLLKFKNHILRALENKKLKNLQAQKETTTLTIYSEPIKKKEPKIYSDLTKLPPIINNNVKMFINKLKRIGYLNDVTMLKPYDLMIINDHAYYEPERTNDSIKFLKTLESLFAKVINKFDALGKFAKVINKFYALGKLFHLFHFPIIHPSNKTKFFWDLLISFLIVFLIFYTPLSLCFDLDLLDDGQKICIASLLITDMVFEMNTLYFNFGSEVQDREKIFFNYLKSFFLLDLVSVLSIVLQIQHFQNSNFGKAFVLFIFLKIFSLIKISRRMMNRFQWNHEWKGVKDLLILFFVIILITHIVACGWYQIGVSLSQDNARTWIKAQGLQNEDSSVKYMTSFYWAIVTIMTVGYGDITPQNNSERLFCLFVILFGCMIFPYSINSIGLIIQDIQREKKKFELIYSICFF